MDNATFERAIEKTKYSAKAQTLCRLVLVEEMTLSAVADMFGVTRQFVQKKVRKIEGIVRGPAPSFEEQLAAVIYADDVAAEISDAAANALKRGGFVITPPKKRKKA